MANAFRPSRTHHSQPSAKGFMMCSKSVLPVLPPLVLTFAAFLLLTLTTFSLPITSSLYFLESTEAEGVRFGTWGWCLNKYPVCSRLKLGYIWEPQISNDMSASLVLFPAGALLTMFALITLIPLSCTGTARAGKVFAFFALFSWTVSFVSFVTMISVWSVAKRRFEKAGFVATFGQLPWMVLAATLCLLPVAIHSVWKVVSTYRAAVDRENAEAHLPRRNRHRNRY